MTERLLHQPDDPGLQYAPLTFRSSQLGRETAWLGSIMVGEVAPCLGGRLQQASVTIYLPGAPRKFLPASSLERAKRKLTQTTREWIAATGLRA